MFVILHFLRRYFWAKDIFTINKLALMIIPSTSLHMVGGSREIEKMRSLLPHRNFSASHSLWGGLKEERRESYLHPRDSIIRAYCGALFLHVFRLYPSLFVLPIAAAQRTKVHEPKWDGKKRRGDHTQVRLRPEPYLISV